MELNSHLYYDAEVAILSTYPREMKTSPHSARMSTAASPSGEWVNIQGWPSIQGWKGTDCYTHNSMMDPTATGLGWRHQTHTKYILCESIYVKYKTGKTNLLSLGGIKGCGELTRKGYKGVFHSDGNVLCLGLVVVYIRVQSDQNSLSGLLYVCKLYLNRKTRRGGEWEERMKRREGKREGGQMGHGADPPDQCDHFSKVVVLYMLVFLKLHWAVTIRWKGVGLSTLMGKYMSMAS